MWLDQHKLKKLCKSKDLAITEVLKRSGVSRTAYYSLIKRGSILPESIHRLAELLQVSPSSILSWEPEELAKLRRREVKLQRVLKRFPEIDKENAWHALILLEMQPLERLRGALRRGN